MKSFVKYLKDYTDNKKICILGFGREGKSTYKMLKKYCSCKSITICDLNDIDTIQSDNVDIITGKNYQKSLDEFDIVFKSPGIVLEKSPELLKCEISSETQVFFSCYRNQIIGITGTKGKSTVSSMIYHILKENNKDCRLVGNIGVPVFDIADSVEDETIIVCELSCHQLEYMTVSPTIAVMLNIYEEHLDHYGTIEKYISAKQNIYRHQNEKDILLCNYDLIPEKIASDIISVSNKNKCADVFVNNAEIIVNNKLAMKIATDKIKLLGVHNQYNIAVAYIICKMKNITDDCFIAALSTFNPLAHRLEFVAEVNGVKYYDDSISTACATAIEAINSVPNPGTILIGGMDRGIDYTELISFLMNTDINVICMEASGKRIFDIIKESEFQNKGKVCYIDHLDEAVKHAAKITEKGMSCILSPAAASYGIFKNFEERGDAFKSLVLKLENKISMNN